MPPASALTTLLLTLLLMLCLACSPTPDVTGDQDDAYVNLYFTDGDTTEYDSVKMVYLALYDNRNFAAISLSATGSLTDTAFVPDSSLSADTIPFPVRFTLPGQCTVQVTATLKRSSRDDTTLYLPVYVRAPKPSIALVNYPDSIVSHAGRADTLFYVPALYHGATTPVGYALTSTPKLDENSVAVFTSVDKTSFGIVLKEGLTFDGTLFVRATARSADGDVSTSVTTRATRKPSLRPTPLNLPDSLDVDSTTHATFTFNKAYSKNPGNLSLYLSDTAKTAITAEASAPDTFHLTFTPTDTGRIHFGIIAATPMVTDTFFYRIPVQAAKTPDSMPPAIIQIYGAESGSRVTEPLGEISFYFSDTSGVDTAYWRLNGGEHQPLFLTQDTTATISYSFDYFGINRFKVYACDKSSLVNTDSFELQLDYNTLPIPHEHLLPSDLSTEVTVVPALSWSGTRDADGDLVYSFIRYGTSPYTLSLSTDTVTGNTIRIPPEHRLASQTTYYWSVTSFTSGSFTDTIYSPVYSFTTGSVPAAIAAHPVHDTATEGGTAGFTVEATGDAPLTFEWLINGTTIPGANSAILLLDSVSLSIDNSYFRCIVSNASGKDTSEQAQLHVVPLPVQKLSIAPGNTIQQLSRDAKKGYPAKTSITSPVKNMKFDTIAF